MVNEPPDFIGNILAKLFNRQLENPSIKKRVEDWNMSVVLQTDYYPLSVIFDNGITVLPEVVKDPTLIFTMNFSTIISLVQGKTTMMRAMLKGLIKVKGLFRNIRAAYRFYTLMNSILEG